MTNAAKRPSEGAWERAQERFGASGEAGPLLEARTAQVEAELRAAYDRHLAAVFPEGLALLAVGGFGRRELFPYSDVDLLLLVDRESAAERHKAVISSFLRDLWDAGLRASHSFRTPQECCELHEDNIELHISLLDQRFLLGDAVLYGKLGAGLPRFLHGQRQNLLRQLVKMGRERHARFQELMYQLEPNVKEAPGGLRDLQLVRWAAQLRNTHPERFPPLETAEELAGAREFLFAVRCFLHFQARRDSNVLTFDAQEQIVQHPGFQATTPAVWMREYFRNARAVLSAAARQMEAVEEQSSSLLVQFRDWRSRVSNAEFFVSKERVFFRAPQQVEQDPDSVLRLFQFVARHGLKLARETESRLQDRLPRLKRHFAESRPLWEPLKELLELPHAPLAMRAMQDSGVLNALFPEWERIECLVVRDFYHRYTVDEHTLVALQNLSALRGDAQRRSFAGLLEETDEFGALGLALLFHDLGKARRSGSHVAESVELAAGALERIQVPEETRQLILALIEKHLELSAALTTRDLHDPATGRMLAERAETVEFLRLLTLMTYADIAAVNPGAMTPWRADQLWQLYLVTYHELTRELEDRRIDAPAAGPAEFLEGLPVRYLRTHKPAEVAAHAELARRSAEHGVALDITRKSGTYRLTLVAKDRPFLLASIAGALASFGMNILKAEGFANRQGQILDTFVFADPHRTLELNPPEMDRLRLMLERVALGRANVKMLLQSRPKPALPSRGARVAPRVAFDAEASETATLIHVTAQDRPGLLYDLTGAISSFGCNVELALIDTEAHRALDVFYVTYGGKKLSEAQQQELAGKLTDAARGSAP